MGCVTATAKRRRKQAVNNYRHIAPMRRPRYKAISKETSERREAHSRERRIAMQGRKGKKR